jgi:hypothetical protein
MSLNIEFQPVVSPRNFAPTRLFVTKWDVEIDNNRAKKISRNRERDAKYFQDPIQDPIPVQKVKIIHNPTIVYVPSPTRKRTIFPSEQSDFKRVRV